MRNIFFILLLIPLFSTAQKLSTDTVMTARILSSAPVGVAPNDTFSVSLKIEADQLGQGYDGNMIATGYILTDELGRRFRVSSISSQSAADFSGEVVEMQGDHFIPFGNSATIQNQLNNGLQKVVPSDGNQGITPALLSRLLNHNLYLVDSLLSVMTGGTVDSTRLTQDSILVYYQNGSEVGRDTITGTGGGSGSTEVADGVTITGDGSGGSPFTVDTSLIATTQALNDSIAANGGGISGLTTGYIINAASATTLENSPVYTSSSYVTVGIGSAAPSNTQYTFYAGNTSSKLIAFGSPVTTAPDDPVISTSVSGGGFGRIFQRQLNGNTNDIYIGDIDSNGGKVVFRADGSTSMVIHENGTIGIGTGLDAPSSLLVIDGALTVSDATIQSNAGTPESVVTADPGSLVLDTSNGLGYAKATGTTSTGYIDFVGRHGNASDTTDGSGDITITHGLPDASFVVNVTVTGTTLYNVVVHSKTSTTFKIRFFDTSDTPVTTTAVTADWIARNN